MLNLLTGIAFIIFGLLIGGVGIASAGIGIGMPMIPIGIYLFVRGVRSIKHDREMAATGEYRKQRLFEFTPVGRLGLGILLILIGLATSAFGISIPLVVIGGLAVVSSARPFLRRSA